MNGGVGALNHLNQENIPSGANSHQHHVIAITRNFRRVHRRQITNIRTDNINQINQLNVELSQERFNNIQTIVDFMIQQIEYNQTIETITRHNQVEQIEHNEIIETMRREYQVEQVIDRIIKRIENNEKSKEV
ncbi:unnamed protein product [Rotaria sordida]|uniref:Uncharacterized protein n=1 Tax=Rotaria sordida TaxID=392033 RepID=A0A815D8A0_9BILA|nr:unnamed protein product [Rotaria sordida]CAF1569450.1 unnamed protein product [Rotaria sordida]